MTPCRANARMIRRRWSVGGAIAAAIAVPVAVAGSASSLPVKGAAVPTPAWRHCPPAPKGPASVEGFQCATAVVPMDYAKPGGKTFRLALIRYPARRSQVRTSSA